MTELDDQVKHFAALINAPAHVLFDAYPNSSSHAAASDMAHCEFDRALRLRAEETGAKREAERLERSKYFHQCNTISDRCLWCGVARFAIDAIRDPERRERAKFCAKRKETCGE